MQKIMLLLVLCLIVGSANSQANDQASERNLSSLPTGGYFLAPDADGIIQVWRLYADLHAPEVLTSATESIVDFGVSHDDLMIVYASGMNLWLQSVDTDDVSVLATLSSLRSAYPVFSPDDRYLAFANQGIWIIELNVSEPLRLIESQEYDEVDVSSVQYYIPRRFIPNTTAMMVEIGVWEGINLGILDYETGEFEALEDPYSHTDLMPLSDGRLLIYGNNFVYGQPNLRIADGVDRVDLNANQVVAEFKTLFGTEGIAVEDAVEIASNVVRFMGTRLPVAAGETGGIILFDFDFSTNTLLSQQILSIGDNPELLSLYFWNISPDGSVISTLLNATGDTSLDSRGIVTGQLGFYALATNATYTFDLPQVSSFIWK